MKEAKLYRFIECMGALIIALIILILLVLDNRVNYVYQSFCKVPNVVFVGIIVAVLLGYYFLCQKGKIGKQKANGAAPENSSMSKLQMKLDKRNLIIMSVIILGIQLIVAWQVYFKTGWDCGKLVQMAQEVAFSNRDIGADEYFSRYPNNVLLVAVFALVLRFARFLGFNADYFPLIMLGCFLVNAAGFFMTDCVRKLTKKNRIAFAAWVVYVILSGLSPWISIPYSDTYSILFPVLCIWLYMKYLEKKKVIIWALIGFCAWIGSYIKPTVLLVLIVLVGIECWSFLCTFKKETVSICIKRLVLWIATLLISISLAAGLNALVKNKMGCTPDETKEFTPMHYLMMGLNYKTGGTYDQWDVNYSASAANVEDRNELAYYQIKYRISSMGVKGLGAHFTRKLLTNFNDGTFAWGNEGEFYWNVLEKNNVLSKALRNYYYEDGGAYPAFQIVAQAVWIMVLCLAVCIGIRKKEESNQMHAVVVLSVLAITCFVMIFEARARYLYLYSPVFILAAALGLERFLEKAQKGSQSQEEQAKL